MTGFINNIRKMLGTENVEFLQTDSDDDSCYEIPVPTGLKYQFPGKGDTIRYHHEVSLEELYSGSAMTFVDVPVDKACEQCAGKGSVNGILEDCIPCNATGIGNVDVVHGVNLYKVCNVCCGFGKKAPEGSECQECAGTRLVKGSQRLVFNIDKGYDPERCPLSYIERKTLIGNANASRKVKRGDIEIIIVQKPHPKFTRKSDDLFYDHTISLAEAMCGFAFTLRHLDGRELLVSSKAGEVTQPGEFKFIPNEGMPVWNFGYTAQEGRNGKLYVRCNVTLPVPGSSLRDPEFHLVNTHLQKVKLVGQSTDLEHQANAASGMSVDNECKLKFMELKTKRTHRFIIIRLMRN